MQPMLLKLTSELYVDPLRVSALEWVRSDYRPTTLNIHMATGASHSLEHAPHRMDGVDCYKIQDAIISRANSVPVRA